uniref:Uncharacterized protein n=1 Tax=viral metagenome TaxID=1070528 RepID=A0A6C0F089_9ZZZZ
MKIIYLNNWDATKYRKNYNSTHIQEKRFLCFYFYFLLFFMIFLLVLFYYSFV